MFLTLLSSSILNHRNEDLELNKDIEMFNSIPEISSPEEMDMISIIPFKRYKSTLANRASLNLKTFEAQLLKARRLHTQDETEDDFL
jgi:coproporphyrinogen III oxidase-like Fe-S oxidoreductase